MNVEKIKKPPAKAEIEPKMELDEVIDYAMMFLGVEDRATIKEAIKNIFKNEAVTTMVL